MDDYVLYLLRQMRSVCSELVTISNGTPTDEGMKRLSQNSDTLFCRENQGMDAGALKDFFTGLCPREYWTGFDELVWFNDTCYGPLIPMEDVYREMERREPCDFWGITLHAKSNANWPGSKKTGIQEHLQAYFVNVNQRILKDNRFFSFWKDMEVSNNFNATVANYELAMTEAFTSWGYQCGVYCDTRNLDTNPDYVCNLTAEGMYLLVSRYRCPFVKRKSFIRTKPETLVHANGEQASRVMDYIRSHTLYDTFLIYRNLMRLYDQSLWRGNLCHDYILCADHSSDEPVPASLILAELDHEDSVWELAELLDSLPENCVLEAVTRVESLVGIIQKQLPVQRVRVLPEAQSGLASLFAVLWEDPSERYDYVCILQENWGNPDNALHLPESSTRFCLYGNLVNGPHFIRNLLHAFEKAPLLGIMEPPEFPQAQVPGKQKRKTTQAYAAACAVTLPWKQGPKPIVSQPSLWCRREIISAVGNQLGSRLADMEDGALECLISYIALSEGYYCAEVMEQQQAACLLENQRWIVDCQKHQKLLLYRKRLQAVSAINSGRIKPEDSPVSAFELLQMLIVCIVYSIEKKFRSDIPQEKKESFFLGVRDVYHAYRRVRMHKRRK